MTPLVRRFFTREVVSQIRMRPAVDRNAAFPLHSRIDNGSAIFPSTVMPIENTKNIKGMTFKEEAGLPNEGFSFVLRQAVLSALYALSFSSLLELTSCGDSCAPIYRNLGDKFGHQKCKCTLPRREMQGLAQDICFYSDGVGMDVPIRNAPFLSPKD
uniref:Uncharacterized protein n=1 Tax=Steinernema glaseri TaxID=37863 RepID=A0A1I7YEA6_9BILA